MMRYEVEMCPHCDKEVYIQWDVEADGYQIKCPHCGELIMLCDACYHSEDNYEHRCDWCKEHGCFRKPIKPPYYRLTENGKAVAEAFCAECVAYRKELLDGAKDTNYEEVPLPNVQDIEDDLNFFPLKIGEDYCNGWGITDNYDLPLSLDYGTDFILES